MATRQRSRSRSKAADRKSLAALPPAHAMIDAIINAAAKILRRDGWSGFNTNAIALAAGISVGSLYQYFANKEEITVAMVERQYIRLKDKLMAELTAAKTSGTGDLTGLAIHAFASAFLEDDGLYFTLRQELSGYGVKEVQKMFDDCITFLVATFEFGKARLRPNLSATDAFVIVHAVDGVLMAGHRRRLPPEQMQELEQQLVVLVRRYIVA